MEIYWAMTKAISRNAHWWGAWIAGNIPHQSPLGRYCPLSARERPERKRPRREHVRSLLSKPIRSTLQPFTTLPPIDRHADLRSSCCIHMDSVPVVSYWDSGCHPLPTDQIDKILPIDIYQIALNPPFQFHSEKISAPWRQGAAGPLRAAEFSSFFGKLYTP